MKAYVLAVLVLNFSVTASTAQKIAVTQGTRLESTVHSQLRMGIEMQGTTMNNSFEVTGISGIDLKSVNKEGYTFLNTLKAVKSHIKVGEQDVNYDSDKPEDAKSEAGQAFRDKIGKADTIQVNASGKIVSSSQISAAQAGASDVTSMVSQLSVGQPYPYLLPVPSGAMPRVGDSWTDSSGASETMKSVITYKLESIQNNEVIISFDGVVTSSSTMDTQGMEMKTNMRGPMSGKATFDQATGLLKINTTTMDIKGNMEVAGQSFTMTMAGEVVTTVKKL